MLLPYSIDTDLPICISQDFPTTTPYSLLEIGSTTPAGLLSDYLSVSITGFGTTTLSGLNVSGSATSHRMWDLISLSGCYAVGNTCISGSGGGSGTVTSITAGSGLAGGTITTSGTITNPNIVNSGLATQVAYYLTNGTAVSGTSTMVINPNESVTITGSSTASDPGAPFFTVTGTQKSNLMQGENIVNAAANGGSGEALNFYNYTPSTGQNPQVQLKATDDGNSSQNFVIGNQHSRRIPISNGLATIL